jgi:hypothetical protein
MPHRVVVARSRGWYCGLPAPDVDSALPIVLRRKPGRFAWRGYGGPAQPSPTRSRRAGWLQVKCHRCETEASIPLDCVRRPRDTPIWKLEASLKCRNCRKGPYAPPVHMIRLTEQRQTVPYVWVHPEEER